MTTFGFYFPGVGKSKIGLQTQHTVLTIGRHAKPWTELCSVSILRYLDYFCGDGSSHEPKVHVVNLHNIDLEVNLRWDQIYLWFNSFWLESVSIWYEIIGLFCLNFMTSVKWSLGNVTDHFYYKYLKKKYGRLTDCIIESIFSICLLTSLWWGHCEPDLLANRDLSSLNQEGSLAFEPTIEADRMAGWPPIAWDRWIFFSDIWNAVRIWVACSGTRHLSAVG